MLSTYENVFGEKRVSLSQVVSDGFLNEHVGQSLEIMMELRILVCRGLFLKDDLRMNASEVRAMYSNSHFLPLSRVETNLFPYDKLWQFEPPSPRLAEDRTRSSSASSCLIFIRSR